MAFLPTTIFFLLLSTSLAKPNCSPQFCGSNPFPILFPFRLQSDPTHCGYPGFALSCSGQDTLSLTLPNSGAFLLRAADYLTPELRLRDPGGCLPARLLTLDLSASPFLPGPVRSYTFLRCPAAAVRAPAIECLSNSTTAVVAGSEAGAVRGAVGVCGVVRADVAVPVTWPRDGEGWLTSAGVGRDLRLTWDEPDCQGCVARGGVCGFLNETSDQISCFADSKKGPSRGLQIFKIISLSIVIPCIICSICISCFTCIVERRASRRAAVAAAADPPLTPPAAAAAAAGLDESTIESYMKVVLGESKRIPGPNGATCPICLVDYHPNDAVRCIPECEHCFHSDCVDEWLRLNSTCPVCRNSPSRSIQIVT